MSEQPSSNQMCQKYDWLKCPDDPEKQCSECQKKIEQRTSKKLFRITQTRCGCHPETCCCPDFTVLCGDEVVCGGSDRESMQALVDAANRATVEPSDLLREVVDALECRDPSEAHYCPNCDRSLYDITQKVRASLTKDAGECGACDKPGEHCANVHGICSRHGGRAHETSAGDSK